MAASASEEEGLATLAGNLGSQALLLRSCLEASEAAAQGHLRASITGNCWPVVVVRPLTVEGVSACVTCAASLGMPVSVIGGAHTAFCAGGRIIVDLEQLQNVDVDVETRLVTVGGGATAKQIQQGAQLHGLAVPLGTAPTVGAGLLLQGGIGHLSRRCGLSLDSLVAARVVVADGSCITASADENGDVFWALRGFGPNFGVVVSLTLRAFIGYPVVVSRHTFVISGGSSSSGLPNGAKLLHEYGCLAVGLPRVVSADCLIFCDGDGHLHMDVHEYREQEVPDASEVNTCVITRLSATSAVEERSERLSLVELFDREPYLLEQPAGTLLPAGPAGLGFHVKAVFLASPMEQLVADLLINSMTAAPCSHCFIHLQHAGGAVADTLPDDTAFSARGLEWSVVVSGCWPKPDKKGMEDSCVAWVQNTVAALLPVALGTYSTDLGPNDGELARFAICRETLARLGQLKHTWDPQNLFRCGFPLKQAVEGLQ